MSSYALTVDKFLDHAAKWHGAREVATSDGRIGYAALRDRANRISGALLALGLSVGDRIGTLAWNTQHHLEISYAAMGAGIVCHTLNPRLALHHLAAMIEEAEDEVLAVASSLLPLAETLLPLCPRVRTIVALDAAAPQGFPAAGAEVIGLDALIAKLGAPVPWGCFDEESPAGLCYTSGTTGRPKGVLYTHRANYLHTLRALQADAFALTAKDSVLVAVPMFHANGWGLPFAAPAVGAKLVLPGRRTDGESLYRLMREEAVTVAAGVQTVWLALLDHIDAVGGALPALKRVLIGGSACPEALVKRIEGRLGAEVQMSWGMTELAPLGVVTPPGSGAPVGAGRPPVGLDLVLVDADGAPLPDQRRGVGRLKVKGASVISRYFKAKAAAVDAEGYFDTGDLASIDEAGNLILCGRAKDLIKSGGEWINPAEIEEIVGRRDDVALVAVIARPDQKWGERPVLVIEPAAGLALDADALLMSLKGEIPEWWIPDEVVEVATMPLAATGKIDKLRLRAEYVAGELAGATAEP